MGVKDQAVTLCSGGVGGLGVQYQGVASRGRTGVAVIFV